MKASELRKMSRAELDALLQTTAREQFGLRMQKATGQLSRPDQIRKLRREIARIKTVIRQNGIDQ